MAYDATTLQPAGAFDDEPSSIGRGHLARGGGLSADSERAYVYGATADGPFTAGTNFGQSVFKLSQVGQHSATGGLVHSI